MNSQILKKVCALSVGLVTGFLSSSCTMAPSADEMIFAAAGSSWTYERRDSGSFGNGTAQQTNRALGERTWQGRRVWATETPQGIRLSDLNTGDWLAVVMGDFTVASWEPSLGRDWPLTVGKTFSWNYRFVNHVLSKSTEIRSTTTVESYEDITVTAGTFKTFKLRYTDSQGVDSVQWYSPDIGASVKVQSKRNSNFPAGPGTQDLELLSYSFKK